MKVIGNFNNISKELKPKPLKRGEVAQYRLLTGRLDPGRLDENGKPTMQYGKAIQIPTRDNIYDPYKQEFVDIGVVDEFKNNEVLTVKTFMATAGGDFIFDGVITLSGDSNADVEFYEFFEITNLNKSFEHRDPSITPMIERIDLGKDDEKKIKVVSVLADALVKATTMNLSDMRDFAAQMNWNEIAEANTIKAQVLDFAEKNPQKFLDLIGDAQSGTRSLIKQAITKGIINYDSAQHRIVWGKTDQTIAILDRIDGKNHVEIFADWLIHAKNGSSVKTKIEQQVRGTRKEAMKEGVE